MSDSISYSENIIDLEFIAKSISDDKSVINEILSLFKEMAREYDEKMIIALHEKDFEAIFQAAHHFGSSCKMLGFDKLYDIVREIEDFAFSKTQFAQIQINFLQAQKHLNIITPEIDKTLTN
jgi:HPt (histidine-containing phosphotransfer) domain-containing protein